MKPAVSLVTIGRFHHFHLARELERHGLLRQIFTGYPRFKLRTEAGIPPDKIRPFPWTQVPFLAVRSALPLWAAHPWLRWSRQILDFHASSRLAGSTVLIAGSGSGLQAGRRMREQGGFFVCDRGSAHIRVQDEILREEYRRWGFEFRDVDPRMIVREEKEYALADRICVPSKFSYRTFLEKGVPEDKLVTIPYGVRLDRFRRTADVAGEKFTILFVGQISLRKGFMYLLEAFRKFQHPGKELVAIGAMSGEVRSLLKNQPDSGVKFVGNIPNAELPDYYSRAHVFVLPSVEEGFGMVLGEAMACGCPVIASANTGGADLIENEREGFIVPVGSADAILERLDRLAQDPQLRRSMGESAFRRVSYLDDWQQYGSAYAEMLLGLGKAKPRYGLKGLSGPPKNAPTDG